MQNKIIRSKLIKPNGNNETLRAVVKVVALCLFSIFVTLILPNNSYEKAIIKLAFDFENEEQDIGVIIEEQLKGLDLSGLESYLSGLEDDLSLFNGGVIDKVKAVINGEFTVNTTSVIDAIIKLLFSDLASLLPIIASIVAICILSSMVIRLRSDTFKGSTADIVFFACYGIIIVIVLMTTAKCFTMAQETIKNIAMEIEIIMPVLITLMVATGGNVSAKVYQPAIAMLSGGVVEIVSKIIFPMFLISVVLAVVSNLSSNVKVNKLADFFKSTSIWIMGITFMLFTAFLSIQGLTAATIDGVSIRAVKFAAKNYIPILGGYLSDGFDLILAGSILIKNAVGVTGLVILLITIVSPIIKILTLSLGFKLLSAIVEPIADDRITKFISSIGKNLTILIVCILALAFMFLITVMLIIMTTNGFM